MIEKPRGSELKKTTERGSDQEEEEEEDVQVRAQREEGLVSDRGTG